MIASIAPLITGALWENFTDVWRLRRRRTFTVEPSQSAADARASCVTRRGVEAAWWCSGTAAVTTALHGRTNCSNRRGNYVQRTLPTSDRPDVTSCHTTARHCGASGEARDETLRYLMMSWECAESCYTEEFTSPVVLGRRQGGHSHGHHFAVHGNIDSSNSKSKVT